MIVSFQVHYGAVQSQNGVLIYMDLTVLYRDVQSSLEQHYQVKLSKQSPAQVVTGCIHVRVTDLQSFGRCRWSLQFQGEHAGAEGQVVEL